MIAADRASKREYSAIVSGDRSYGDDWIAPVLFLSGAYVAIIVESVAGKFNVGHSVQKLFSAKSSVIQRLWKTNVVEEETLPVSEPLDKCESTTLSESTTSTVDLVRDVEDVLETKTGIAVIVSRKIDPMAYNILIGDAFHNTVDGVIIASAFTLCNEAVGWIVLSSVVLHELPQEMLDFLMLLKAGMTVKQALLANFFSSLSAILGAAIALSVASVDVRAQAYMILFGSGMLTFVSMSELIPMLLRTF